jgi:hypothetical protein
VDVSFEGIKDGRYKPDLTVVQVLAQANAPSVFGIDVAPLEELIKSAFGVLALLPRPTCHGSRLAPAKPRSKRGVVASLIDRPLHPRRHSREELRQIGRVVEHQYLNRLPGSGGRDYHAGAAEAGVLVMVDALGHLSEAFGV